MHVGRIWGLFDICGWVIKHLLSLLSSQGLISLKAFRHDHDEAPQRGLHQKVVSSAW